MSFLAFILGVFGVYAGWHWKLMHRSWQDLRLTREQAKGKIPALKAARSHHTGMAFWFAVAAAVVLFALLRVH